MYKRIFLSLGALGLSSVFSNIFLASFLGVSYSNLSAETRIAELEFRALEKNIYEATLYDGKGIKIGKYKIYGDQWRIDVAFIKMKYWAVALGADSTHSLDRLEGRYADIKAQNSQKHQAYALENHQLATDFSWFVDTTYGSSVYQTIKPHTCYSIYKGAVGLVVREKEAIR